MASRRDLRHFLAPILDADSMLAWDHPYLFVGPVHHVAVILEFHPGDAGIQSFVLDGGVQQFVEHTPNSALNPRRSHALHVISSGINVYDFSFRDCFLERVLLPAIEALRQVDTCQRYRQYCSLQTLGAHRRRILTDNDVLLADLPLGEFEQFHRAWPTCRHRIERVSDGWYRPGAIPYMAGLWDAIDRGDLGGLAGLMHDWERRCVEEVFAAHLWAPSPFPFEEPNPENWRDVDAAALEKPFLAIRRTGRAFIRRRHQLRSRGLLPP